MKLHYGDCLEVLRTMPDCSVDAVVTDPPYGLAFMGKRWDYDVPSVEIWAECLRVLKPGGHLLAFAGTRTQHRMAVRIEDAGFEIRDMVAWVYGSGFPKSHNVGKAIDKRGGVMPWQKEFAEHLRAIKPVNLRATDINAHIANGTKSNFWGHFIDTKSQPLLPTVNQYRRLKEILPIESSWDQQFLPPAERDVVGQKTSGIANPDDKDRYTIGGSKAVVVDITAPATEAAQQWSGWGTALKPALEPITVARKPLAGTVAENVLQWGTGGLNVDGCRVTHGDDVDLGAMQHCRTQQDGHTVTLNNPGFSTASYKPSGRWPANLIHDGSDEVVELFPLQQSGANPTKRGGMGYHGADGQDCCNASRGADSGSAARFFKQCKGYTEAWPDLPPEPASTAGNCSSQQRRFVAFALSDAATWALHGASCNNVSLAPSTSATANELRQLSESVITAIQSIAPKFWQESKPARLSLSLNHANFAVIREQTGITTITASHWKSDGSADPVTFSITASNTEDGARASAPRAFYTAKASRADREDGNRHPTVKPTDLMRYLCRLVTPPCGIVLDPFMGSGSTGKAAMLEGFEFIGIERDADSYATAERRINRAAAMGHQPSLL